MEKVIVTADEISLAQPEAQFDSSAEKRTASPVPMWTKLILAPLVLALPLLAIVTAVLRTAIRNQPPRTRQAITSYLCSLLVASALLTSASTVILLFMQPSRFVMSSGLTDLDECASFPHLPKEHPLTASQIGEIFKPLVVVISPENSLWFGRGSEPSDALGSGLLLYAGVDGYLFATAKHVIDAYSKDGTGVMLHTVNGAWARGVVVGRHQTADAALVWMRRVMGSGRFCQPVASDEEVAVGDPVFVIGHPVGLTFALSTGIVSRLADPQVLQISAPISPGNSGGPVYDDSGRLVGIVTSMFDTRLESHAQNLNFALRADVLTQPAGWRFTGNGVDSYEQFLSECLPQQNSADVSAGDPG